MSENSFTFALRKQINRVENRVRRFRDRNRSIDKFYTTTHPAPHGDLEQIMYSGECRRIHKWVHYPAIYERLFSRFRGTPVRFLEIGVFGGGSLDMWRKYLGPAATIHGLDINPECAQADRPDTPVHIGSQDDAAFLKSVVKAMGGLDVVLDDGSHIGRHQRRSFDVLWPLLSENGLYVIEDVHTAYWSTFEGGWGVEGTAISLAKALIDDMHGWYHQNRTTTPAKREVNSVQVFDSIIAIEKARRDKPAHVVIEKTEHAASQGPASV